MSVVVVGLNHRSVDPDLLGAVTVADEDLPKALADLTGREHLGEVVVVSTCMRTEVYVTATRYHGAVDDIRSFLAERSGTPPEALAGHVYEFFDDAAARHLFRVAAGLDSAVLGEGEILRQVRTAWETAQREGAGGQALGVVFRHAVETGKRVRSETAIARGTTSLSHTAVSLAGSVGVPLEAMPPEASGCPVVGHGSAPWALTATAVPGAVPGRVASDLFAAGQVPPAVGEAAGPPCTWAELLAGRSVLVVGAGEMGEALATLVAGAPAAGPVTVVSRRAERAAGLARRVGAQAAPWSALGAAVAEADIVLSATSAPDVVIDAAMVAAAMAGRTDRPLVVVDTAVPRDVAVDVGTLPGVTLFDISHLKAHAEAAMEARRHEIPAADAIVDEEIRRLAQVAAHRSVAPTVAALHARGEEIRSAELARAATRLAGLDDAQRRAVEALTRGIVAKLLHEPTVRLKAAAAEHTTVTLPAAVEELFDIKPE